MNDAPLLVCCGVLRAEVESLVTPGCVVAAPYFLDTALCCNYRALARALNNALAKPGDRERILAFGLCHPAIDAIAARHGAKRVRATNCISMLIGEEAYARAVACGHYFLLPGWATRWRKALIEDLGLDEDNAHELLASEMNKAIYLDTGVIEYPSSLLDEFAAYSGLPVERQIVSLNYLTTILAEVANGVCFPWRTGRTAAATGPS